MMPSKSLIFRWTISEVSMGTTTDAAPATSQARKIPVMKKLDYVT